MAWKHGALLLICFGCLMNTSGKAEEISDISSQRESTTPTVDAEPTETTSGAETIDLREYPEIQKAIKCLTPKAQPCASGPKSQEPAPANFQAYKDRGDLRKYLACALGTSSGRYSSYEAKIESAASAFGLPSSFIACSYLHESTFDPAAVSTKGKDAARNLRGIEKDIAEAKYGCVGIAQINEVTAKQIEVLINSKLADSERESLQKILTENPESLASSPKAKMKILEVRRRATIKLYHDDLARSWERFFAPKPAPTKFDISMLKNPEYAIPAGVLYFKYLALNVMSSFRKESDEFPALAEDPKFMQILAAGYNFGPGTLRGITKRARKDRVQVHSVDTLWNAITRRGYTETKKYMSDINRCMEVNNFERFNKKMKSGISNTCMETK